MAHDENLLFGVLAVQLKFVTPQALMMAAAAWSVNQEGSLREHLVRSGEIGEDTAKLIAGLMSEKVKAHHGDVRATLGSFGGDRAVRESFAASSYLFADGKPLESFGGSASATGPAAPSRSDTPSRAAPLRASEEELENEENLTIEHPARYDLRGEHSRGGIGRVLVAFDAHIGREIAIKELLSDKAGKGPSLDSTDHKTRAAMARFLREARITGQLEHPSIIPVYELGKRPDGSIYYTMKFVRGRTMQDAIGKAKTFDARIKLLTHFLDLANAVSYAHSRGVIHRDLKPANVMVGEFGETVVLDWGLAKVKGRADGRMDTIEREIKLLKESSGFETIKGSPLGTPAYMSPEQTEGKLDQVDERSDVWSMGCVLFELLTGRVPFEGDLAFDIMGKILTQSVPPLQSIEPKVPPELAAIAMKCLEKDPVRRYPDAKALKDDVENYMTGRLVSAYEYSTLALFGRWLKKWWPVAGTAAAAAVILIAVFAWSYVNIRREKEEALRNIAEAYYAYGQWSVNERRWGAAEAYYGMSLNVTDLPRTRYALNHARTAQPIAAELAFMVRGHQAPVTALAVSPGGELLASGDESGAIRLTGIGPREFTAALSGHQKKINALAFTPDGQNLLSVSSDFTARTWDLSGKTVSTARAENELLYLQPLDKGKFAAAGLEKIVYIVESATGGIAARLEGHGDRIRGLMLSPDGKMLMSYSRDRSARIWEMPSGRPLFTLRGHGSSISDGLFPPGGKIAVTSSFDKTIRGWSLEDGTEVFQVETWGPPRQMQLVGDGKKLIAGLSTGALQIVDLERGRGRRRILAHEGKVSRIIALPGSNRFASAGGDMTVKIWELDFDGPLAVIQAQSDLISQLAASPSGELLAVGGAEPLVRVWSLKPNPGLVRLESFPRGFSATGFDEAGASALLAGFPSGIKLLDVKAGALVEPQDGATMSASAAAISPQGDLYAAGTAEGTVHLFGAGGQRKFILSGHEKRVTRAVFGGNGRVLATAGEDGKVMTWDTAAGERLRVFEALAVSSGEPLAISPDGSLLAAALQAGEVKIWELGAGRPRLEIAAHPSGARAVAFSPTGDKLASAGEDGVIIIWDPAAGRERFRIEAHSESVRCLGFSRDGGFLISGGGDQFLKSWDLNSGAPVSSVRVSDQPQAVAFRPDSGLAAAGTSDNKVWLWDWRSGEIMHVFTGHHDAAVNLYFRGNSTLVSLDASGLVFIRPFEDEYLQDPPDQLYQRIVERTGLMVKGMELVPVLSPGSEGERKP